MTRLSVPSGPCCVTGVNLRPNRVDARWYGNLARFFFIFVFVQDALCGGGVLYFF